ncbi:hypothetical protein ACFQQB_02025 [Nonomuraea rubra]|uniref:hypothetical protein n=1 Tax=Nonomuraea rubra TaxID=46180 RepID=UPI0036150409
MNAQLLLIVAAVVVPFLYLPAAYLLMPDPPAAASLSAEPSADGSSLRWGLIALLGLAAFAGHLSEGRPSTGPRCTRAGCWRPIRPWRRWLTRSSPWP